MDKKFFQKNFIKLITIACIVLLLSIIIIIVHSSINSAKINLIFTPTSAIATIDNHKVKSGIISVTPGNHTIEVKKDGFKSITQDISIKSGETINAFYILDSNSDNTKDWYDEHPEDSAISEQILSQENDSLANASVDNYPIIKKLPYETMNYRIDYGACDNNNICIIITAPTAALNAVVFSLKELTSDIGRYSYIINDYTNPFDDISYSNYISSSTSVEANENDAKLALTNILSRYNISIQKAKYLSGCFIISFSYTLNDYGDYTTYRVIIQRKNSTDWALITKPEIILSYNSYPSIPQTIIEAANNI